MKLSEVIKAIEDGSNSEFKNGQFNARREYDMECIEITLSEMESDVFPINGWEEVKPPRQWSEKELMLFKLLPDWVNWITFDRQGIYAFEGKPTQKNGVFTINENDKKCTIDLTDFDFLTITFEESPVYIGDLKGE